VEIFESYRWGSPEALLRPLGIGIHDREFWRKGFEESAAMIATSQKLT
jgi:hypothetical protein